MHILANKKIGFFTYYFVMSIVVEVITFLFLEMGFLPTYFLYDISIILLISGIIFIIPNHTAQFIVSEFFLLCQMVLCYVNYTLYSLYGEIFSIDMFQLFAEAAKAVSRDFTSLTVLIFDAIIMCIIFLIGYFIYRRNKNIAVPFKKNFSLFFVIILLICQSVGISVYMLEKKDILSKTNIYDEEYVLSDRFLIDTNILKAKSFKMFGTFGYYSNSLAVILSDTDKSQQAFYNQADDYFNSGKIYDESDVFGASKDNNVIVIMLESLEWYPFSSGEYGSWFLEDENGNIKDISEVFDVNSTLTPNINGLINESFIATNFFSKNKTNIAEGVGIMGSFPVGKLLTQVAGKSYNTSDNYLSFTMPNVLNTQDYITTYFHPYEKRFYSREITHKNLGFENVRFYEDYMSGAYNFGDWIKEEDMVNRAIDDIIPSQTEKFYTFYTTLATHGPYGNNAKNAEQVAHRQEVLDSDWYANVVADYPKLSAQQLVRIVNCQASIVGLDRAIGIIVNKLKQTPGLYDRTDILLYADHNNYYHNNTYLMKKTNVTEFENFEVNRVPFMLKSAPLSERLEQLEYENYSTRFTSCYDIVPTLFDLLGIEFNENYYIGNSIFKPLPAVADGEEVVAFFSHTGGIFCKKLWTEDIVNFRYLDSSATGNYIYVFKVQASQLVKQISYVNTLYDHKVKPA